MPPRAARGARPRGRADPSAANGESRRVPRLACPAVPYDDRAMEARSRLDATAEPPEPKACTLPEGATAIASVRAGQILGLSMQSRESLPGPTPLRTSGTRIRGTSHRWQSADSATQAAKKNRRPPGENPAAGGARIVHSSYGAGAGAGATDSSSDEPARVPCTALTGGAGGVAAPAVGRGAVGARNDEPPGVVAAPPPK